MDRTSKSPRSSPGDSHYRALRLLEVLAGMDQPATLPAIAAALGLSTQSTYRVLQSLHREGFLDHIGRSGYRIGSRSIALASLVGPRPALVNRVRPVLTKLAAIAEETATLHLRSGQQRTMIFAVEPANNPEHRVVRHNERSPLASGCSGMVILANLPDAQAEAVIDAQVRPANRPAIRQRIRQVRDNAYALSFSANHKGMNGVAVALIDPDDDVALGAIALAGTERRMPEARMRTLAVPLIAAAAEVAPRIAAILGPNSGARLRGSDVTVQDIADDL